VKQVVEVIPNAKRTFAALRDIGYSFNSAVADIIDNSIAAGASGVGVTFRREGKSVWLSIVDDGRGMTDEKLLEAVRLGSDEEYEHGSLGKYGMGLKTASLSQTKCLIVGSRAEDSSVITAFELNLDHIESSNRWELLKWDSEQIENDEQLSYLRSHTGTYVLWRGMDRVEEQLGGYTSSGAADNFFARLLRDLKLHLRMTFHRFLSGEGDRDLAIWFNEVELEPWDPFCTDEPNTIRLRSHSFNLLEGDGLATVRIQPFILPTKDGEGGFSSTDAWEDARGLLPWNDSQGYYVYRNNRLIHFGGWLRTRAKDEHSKYARVAIDFDSDADDLFALSVDKSNIRLPASLFDYLKNRANTEVVKAAMKPYRESAKRGQTGSRHASINRTISRSAPVLMGRHQVSVAPTAEGHVEVTNPKGGFVANTVHEATQFKLRNRFTVQAGLVEDGRLWKLVCKPDGGFLVIINCEHPFYREAYEREGMSQTLVAFMDALLFAMAYVELRAANTASRPLFEEIRDTVSDVLRELFSDRDAEDEP
jgi:hypothetical protein